jgi:hypothetical protein
MLYLALMQAQVLQAGLIQSEDHQAMVVKYPCHMKEEKLGMMNSMRIGLGMLKDQEGRFYQIPTATLTFFHQR